MDRFEYLTSTENLGLADLNSLGSEGWELASHSAFLVESKGAPEVVQAYIFKRKLKI
jgi:hypothetical protein